MILPYTFFILICKTSLAKGEPLPLNLYYIFGTLTNLTRTKTFAKKLLVPSSLITNSGSAFSWIQSWKEVFIMETPPTHTFTLYSHFHRGPDRYISWPLDAYTNVSKPTQNCGENFTTNYPKKFLLPCYTTTSIQPCHWKLSSGAWHSTLTRTIWQLDGTMLIKAYRNTFWIAQH